MSVEEHTKDKKIISYKMRRRKAKSSNWKGHRRKLAILRCVDIQFKGKDTIFTNPSGEIYGKDEPQTILDTALSSDHIIRNDSQSIRNPSNPFLNEI